MEEEQVLIPSTCFNMQSQQAKSEKSIPKNEFLPSRASWGPQASLELTCLERKLEESKVKILKTPKFEDVFLGLQI